MTRREGAGVLHLNGHVDPAPDRTPEVRMADAFLMRFQLQRVVAYRALCRAVQRSGRENVFFALLMMSLAYFTWNGKPPLFNMLVVGFLVGGELLVGLFKWLFPSAEGFLLDAIVLFVFVAYNLSEMGPMMKGGPPPVIRILFTVYMLYGGVNRLRTYQQIRRLFADRPTAEQIAWFDDLVYEIRTADPEQDDQALDLPTKPRWKAKLLGETAFFVPLKGPDVHILGPHDFDISPLRSEDDLDSRQALLRIQDHVFAPFELGHVSWDNYQKWRAALVRDAVGKTSFEAIEGREERS